MHAFKKGLFWTRLASIRNKITTFNGCLTVVWALRLPPSGGNNPLRVSTTIHLATKGERRREKVPQVANFIFLFFAFFLMRGRRSREKIQAPGIPHPQPMTLMSVISSKRSKKIPTRKLQVVCAFTIIFFFLILNALLVNNISTTKQSDIQVFKLQRSKTYPKHLDPIDPSIDLKSIGFQSIDYTHRKGMIHVGSWIHIVDSRLSDNPRILLLKRGKDLVTCPSTWGLIGEHAYRDESPLETARRGLKEELGSRFLDHIDNHGSIKNMTEFPVYYERNYGADNGGRIDRQATYLWLVEMNLERKDRAVEQTFAANDLLELDGEVAKHMWIQLFNFEQRLASPTPEFDFCHDTIVSLLRLGLDRLKILAKSVY